MEKGSGFFAVRAIHILKRKEKKLKYRIVVGFLKTIMSLLYSD